MPSVTALRALLGASLGLGAMDVLWLDLALAPKVVADDDRAQSRAPVLASSLVAAPPAAVASPQPRGHEPPPVVATEEPPAVAAEPIVASEAVHEHRVYFETLSARLDTTAREALDLLAAKDGTFVLEGHADVRGDEALNEQLSAKRARVVAAYLHARGVEEARIEVGFVGEANASEGGDLWRDRRVDIRIDGGTR